MPLSSFSLLNNLYFLLKLHTLYYNVGDILNKAFNIRYNTQHIQIYKKHNIKGHIMQFHHALTRRN